MDKKITILRNVHPDEVSASFLAKKVAERLQQKSYNVFLKTIPFSETYMKAYVDFYVRKIVDPESAMAKHFYYYNRRYSGLSGIIFEFHNYDIYQPTSTSVVTGETSYKHPTLGYSVLWKANYPVEYQENAHDRQKRIIVLEIPAVWKRFKDPNNPFFLFRHGIVDFRSTKEAGFVSDRFISKLARGIEGLS